jgi:hypothetical protein
METNIDKQKFNRNFELYIRETEPQVTEWLFSKYLYKDIKTIIKNVLYHWDFLDERFKYEDIEAELLMHLIVKREKLKRYKGSWYNILFTVFRMKFLDLIRSHRDQDKSLNKMHEYCKDTKALVELNNIITDPDEDQAPEQARSRKPIAVSDSNQALKVDPELSATLTQSYTQTVSDKNTQKPAKKMEETAEYQALCEHIFKIILKHVQKTADNFNAKLPETEKEAIREEERNDPTYLETDSVIWCYEQGMFVPNIEHLKREAKRNADEKLQQLFGLPQRSN